MNEIQLTAKIKDMIRREFPGVYVQRVSDKFLSGIPDLRIICFGLSGDLEVKINSGKTSVIQDKVLENIASAGGVCGVVNSVEAARLFMHRLYKKGRFYHESGIRQDT